jgi:hypothetical protein
LRTHYLFSFFTFFFSVVLSQTFNVKPYLQNATPTSIHIMWETTFGDESIVNWGESDGLGNSTLGEAQTGQGNYRIHDVHLTDLSPNTRYYYKTITDSLDSDIYDFITPDSPLYESSLRLIAMSDMQKDWSNPSKFEEIVHEGIIAYLEDDVGGTIPDVLDLILIPGDLVDNGLEYSQWSDHFFGPSEPLFSYVPVYPVLGNHENNSSYYFSYFNLPENGSPGYEEHWWWADFSNVRVIGLNSNWDFQLSVQLEWLEDVLQEACEDSIIDFVFAQLHHPHKSELWVPGETDFTGDVIERLEQFTSDCGKPSIHFFGHTHGYSRGQSKDHQHVMINVATAGGNIDYWGEYFQADYDVYSVSQDEWGFVVVDVSAGDNPQFTVKRISRGNENLFRDNTLRDRFTIRTFNDPPSTPNPTFPLGDNINPDTLWLWGSGYTDSDEDEHGYSHWQISNDCNDFTNPVKDIYESHVNWFYYQNTQEGNDLTKEMITGLNGYTDYCWRVRYRDRGLMWSEWSEPQSFTTGESIYSDNLVVNPGGESGTSGWIIQQGIFESVEAHQCSGVTPHAGQYYFCVGGLCNESPYAVVYQMIDVSEFSNCIDNSAATSIFGGYLSNWSGSDQPEMHISFLNEDNVVLGTSEPLTTLNSTWTEFNTSLLIPPGTREIKYTLTGTRHAGTDNDSYFDDLFLQVLENGSCATVGTDLTKDISLPKKFVLHQNFPNPFNPTTTLHYELPEDALVNITIYDILGREVRTLVNQTQDAAHRSVIWDATNDYSKPVSAGIYLYQIQARQINSGQAGEFVQTKKMVLF